METKTKYIKFEQNAVIILDDIDSRSIPLKDLKICELCTLTWKRPVYHYSPSAPAKPDGAGSKNTGYSGHTVPSGLNREESETEKDAETGGGFTIISMGKRRKQKR